MSDAKAHINYSVEDIQRYLTGGMNAKEMHDMEKAALQDPFLADAIEGYSDASFEESDKHLNEIAATLQKESNETKVVTMPTKSFQWWRVAAMVLLVAGVGVFSWYLIGSNSNHDKSENNIAALEKKTDSSAIAKDNAFVKPVDTARLFADNNIARKSKTRDNQPHLKRSPQVTLRSKEAIVEDDKYYRVSTFDSIQANNFLKQADSSKAVALTNADVSLNNNASVKLLTGKDSYTTSNNNHSNQFSGRVTDDKNVPVPNALVSANNKLVTVTDTGGYFKMAAPDSLLNVTVSSVGYETKNLNLSSRLMNNISIQPNTSALNEVVVTGYGSKKIAGNKSAADTSFPVGGWQSFQEYVYMKTHKKFDSTEFEALKSGDVVIEFLIDNNGNPYDFKVLHSLDQQSDAKAIDIIKQGPRWITTKKNKKGKVIINF